MQLQQSPRSFLPVLKRISLTVSGSGSLMVSGRKSATMVEIMASMKVSSSRWYFPPLLIHTMEYCTVVTPSRISLCSAQIVRIFLSTPVQLARNRERRSRRKRHWQSSERVSPGVHSPKLPVVPAHWTCGEVPGSGEIPPTPGHYF
jgi:hypothetical protein